MGRGVYIKFLIMALIDSHGGPQKKNFISSAGKAFMGILDLGNLFLSFVWFISSTFGVEGGMIDNQYNS